MDTNTKSYMDRIKDLVPDPEVSKTMTLTPEDREKIQRQMVQVFADGTQYYMNKLSRLAAEVIMPGDVACFYNALEILQKVFEGKIPNYGRSMLAVYKAHANVNVQIVSGNNEIPEDPAEKAAFIDRVYSDIPKAMADGEVQTEETINIPSGNSKKDAGTKRIELPWEQITAIMKHGFSPEAGKEIVNTASIYTDQLMGLVPHNKTSKAFFVAALIMAIPLACRRDDGIFRIAYEIMHICVHSEGSPFLEAMRDKTLIKDMREVEKDIMSAFGDMDADNIGS